MRSRLGAFVVVWFLSGCQAYDRGIYARFIDAGDVLASMDAADRVAVDASDAGTNRGADADASDASICGVCTGTSRCCGANCDDLVTDPQNCGACGAACPGTTCSGGRCTGMCAAGFLDCDGNAVNGCETDGTRDNAHCGTCGRVCGASQSCQSGGCRCDAGFGDCDGNPANGCEVDLGGDVAHCGTCATVCGANAVCMAGACQCDSGWQRCGTASACSTMTQNDSANCGVCGHACSGATPVCSGGSCGSGCSAGETLCGTACADLTTDASHCGACAMVCSSAPNASPRCAAGACGFSCSAGYADCDGSVVNGCEANLATSAQHCGTCSTACQTSQICLAGACACPAGQIDCGGGHCASCCVNADCSGGCTGSSCATQRVCTSGACVDICATGYTSCSGSCRNLQTDNANCGACGVACSTGQGCLAGACVSTVPASCADALARGLSTGDGVYTIDPTRSGDPTRFTSVYCDMTHDGGGWTLVLKADGTLPTFSFEQTIWTDASVLNATATDLSHTEAKFLAFSNMAFTQLRLRFDLAASSTSLIVHASAPSLLAGVNGPLIATSEGRAAWQALVPGEMLQPNCGNEGLSNFYVAPYAQVRIGIVGNQEADCGTPDSFLGVGGNVAGNQCYGTMTQYTSGQMGGAGCPPSGGNVSAFAYVFLR